MSVVDTGNSPCARLKTLPMDAVRITSGLWATRRFTNHEISLPHGCRMLEEVGSLENLRLAAGRLQRQHSGRLATDSDVYKWLEAVAYEPAAGDDAELRRMADEAVELIVAAQDDDGYLMSTFQVAEEDRRWTNLVRGHELYCAGHLFQAAVALDRAFADRRLIDVSLRLVDHIASVLGPGLREEPD